MTRSAYFEKINSAQSPLLQAADQLEQLINSVANESTQDLLAFADLLSGLDLTQAKTRATFIRLQCKGLDAEDLYDAYCESWGIPRFAENLVTALDFKNGFLRTFRDHTSSWSEDNEARSWFYTHIEGRFVRKYEFWTCDQGPEEIVFKKSGSYKEILWSLVQEGDFEAFVSPVFSQDELRSFYTKFDEDELNFDKEALLAIMKQNINW